jgi:YD repeat-containing protein
VDGGGGQGQTDGQLTAVTLPDGRAATVGYDGYGYPSVLTLAGSGTVTVIRDAMGRTLTTTKPGTGTVTLGYDAAGRVITRTDERGSEQGFAYDADGRLTAYTDKSGEEVLYTYDDAGRLSTQTNRNGQTVTTTYDAAGRAVSVTGPMVSRSYGYDALGRLVSAVDGSVTVARTWSETGLASETLTVPGLSPVTQTYVSDVAGRPTSSTNPWGGQTYAYDARGRLGSVTDGVVGAFSFGYDNADRMSSLTWPSGASTSRAWDAAGRLLSSVTEDPAEAALYDLGWTYGSDGLPATRTDGQGTHSYGHDAAGRLTSVDHASASDEAYTYDAASRRTSWAGHPSAEVVYDSGDRLVQDAQWAYAYDLEGQRVSRTSRSPVDTAVPEVWAYTWDGLGQLREVEAPDGDTWTYVYDALNRRVGVAAPEGTSWFVYDGDIVRAELDGSGALVRRWVTGFGFGEVLASVEGGAVTYALRDSLGTATAWMTPSGAVSEVVRDGYGVRAVAASRTEPWGYTGHAEDSSGLVWGRARYLEPGLGVWLSEEPVRSEPVCGYVGGRVSSAVDLDGRMAEATLMVNSARCRALRAAAFFVVGFSYTALDRYLDSAPWYVDAFFGGYSAASLFAADLAVLASTVCGG